MIQHDWPTQTQDLQIANEIIDKYQELNEGEPLGFIEIVVDKSKKKPLQIRIPEWIQEIIDHFRDQYGHDEGGMIAGKVLTRILLKNETIH